MWIYAIYRVYLMNTVSPKSPVRILFDANAIIELHSHSLWKHVIHSCNAAVTPIIRREARYYNNERGNRNVIDLIEDIKNKRLEEIEVSMEIFQSLSNVLKKTFLEGIDEGEREAISFLYQNRKKNLFRFCSADMLAIKCLGVLGMSHLGISMEELFEKINLKPDLSTRYKQTHSKELLKRMLAQGFQESHLHKK